MLNMTPRRSIPLLAATCLVAAALGYTIVSRVSAEAPAKGPVASELVAELAPQSSAFQQDILADGTVSWDEHESAIARTAACLGERSTVVLEVNQAVGKSPTRIGFSAATVEEGEIARGALEDCKHEFLTVVDQVWGAQNRPSELQMKVSRNWYGKCMSGRGVAIPNGGVSNDDLRRWSAATDGAILIPWVQCSDAHQAEFGYLP